MTSRAHGLVISLTLGLAAAVAAYAVIVTAHVAKGTTKPEVAAGHAIAARERKLDAWEASLRKALAARPPAVPAKARYGSVVLVSPPGAMVLPRPAAVPSPPASKKAAVKLPRIVPERSRPKQVQEAGPKSVAPAPPRNEDDGKDGDERSNPAPVQVSAPSAAEVAVPAPVVVASAPVVAATPAPSAKASAEEQCRAILRAAENQSEKIKQAAEDQCEALKQAAERKG